MTMQAPPGLTEAQVRNIVQAELTRLSREALPASMRTRIQNTAEQRIVEKLNVTSRTRLTLDDIAPATDRYLTVDANGFATYKQVPYSSLSGTPPFGGVVLTGNFIASDPAAPVTAPWRMGGDGTNVLPRMTTAQRPGAPAKGEFHWNETQNNAEIWDGNGYVPQLPDMAPSQPIYEALRTLGAAGLPLAMNFDPVNTGTTPNFAAAMARDRLSMFAFQVPRTCVTTGLTFFTDTIGAGYPGTMYNGAGLWQFNANGDAIFIIDSGATNGTPWATLGNQGWNWTTPQTLFPGIVYLMGACHMCTAAGTPAIVRGVNGTAVNLQMTGPFFRSGGAAVANGATRAQVMKSYTAAQLTIFGNMPHMYIF